MTDGANDTAGRELRFSRVLDAPVELVWEVWTDPAHIKQWWGPDGVRNTIRAMDMKPGGRWSLVMHNPDGRDHDIEIVFMEIIPLQKIVFEQLNHFRHIATIELKTAGSQTFLDWTMLFETREALVQAAKEYGVDPGLEKTGERLVGYLGKFKN